MSLTEVAPASTSSIHLQASPKQMHSPLPEQPATPHVLQVSDQVPATDALSQRHVSPHLSPDSNSSIATAIHIVAIKEERVDVEPPTPVRLLMGMQSSRASSVTPIPIRSQSGPEESRMQLDGDSHHSKVTATSLSHSLPPLSARAQSSPPSPERGSAQSVHSRPTLHLPPRTNYVQKPDGKQHITFRQKLPSLPLSGRTLSSGSNSTGSSSNSTNNPASIYKVDNASMEMQRAKVEAEKRKRVASIAPVRNELLPVRGQKKSPPGSSRAPQDIHAEVQSSFEALAQEFAMIDEYSLLARHGMGNQQVSHHELIERRAAAVEYCNQLHKRCEAAQFHIWCPSEAGILSFQRHVEEDLGSLQDEINALTSRGRSCDQLLLLRRKLLCQRYFWRTRLNAVEG